MKRVDDLWPVSRSVVRGTALSLRGLAVSAAASPKAWTVSSLLAQITFCTWCARHSVALPEAPRIVRPLLAYGMERYMESHLSSVFTGPYGSVDLSLNPLELGFCGSLLALVVAIGAGNNRVGRGFAAQASRIALAATASMACFSAVALAVTGITHRYDLIRNLLSVEITMFALFCLAELVRNRGAIDGQAEALRDSATRGWSRLLQRRQARRGRSPGKAERTLAAAQAPVASGGRGAPEAGSPPR